VADFWQQVVVGLATGSLYGLLALALVLIYRSTHVLNFAQGEMAMFSTFLAWSILIRVDNHYWVMFPLAVLVAAALGGLIERVVVRPVEGAPILNIVIVTLGLYAVFSNVASWRWTGRPKAFPVPPEIHVAGLKFFGGDALHVGPTVINYHDLTIMVFAVAIMVALYLFFQHTPLGLAMRATAHNPVASRLMGIRVGRMLTIGWALSAAVGAVAGLLIAPIVLLTSAMMVGALLYAFAAAVVGGLDSPLGAIVGGLIIGVSENLVGAYTPQEWLGPEMKLTVTLCIILVVLLVRPTGIFGRRALRRV
jgi:branched-chain amino acid transport system permease protein